MQKKVETVSFCRYALAMKTHIDFWFFFFYVLVNRVLHLTDRVLPRTVELWDGCAMRKIHNRKFCWQSSHTILKRVMHKLTVCWTPLRLSTQSGWNSCPIMEALHILAYIGWGSMVINLKIHKQFLCLLFIYAVCLLLSLLFCFVTLIWLFHCLFYVWNFLNS